MKHIWSPWRMNYIMNHEPSLDCVFCKALEEEDSSKNLIVFRGHSVFLILNRYPYTSGHVMAVPYAHVPSLEALTADARAEMMEVATAATQVLQEIYHPQGFNLGINLGEAAGAGIASHVHFHIVPRWSGDSNFMTSVAGTRVLPEDIEETYRRIRETWARLIIK